MDKQLRIVVYVLYGFLALLALGWAWGAATNWEEIASRPVRLAYVICDFALVIPLGVAAGWGLLQRKAWAFFLFPLALGALLFDVAHGVFYLIWDNYFGVPWIVAFALLLTLGVYLVMAFRAVQRAAVRVGS